MVVFSPYDGGLCELGKNTFIDVEDIIIVTRTIYALSTRRQVLPYTPLGKKCLTSYVLFLWSHRILLVSGPRNRSRVYCAPLRGRGCR